MTRFNIISEIPELTYKGIVAMVLVLCPSSSPDHTWTGPRFKVSSRIGRSFSNTLTYKGIAPSHTCCLAGTSEELPQAILKGLNV